MALSVMMALFSNFVYHCHSYDTSFYYLFVQYMYGFCWWLTVLMFIHQHVLFAKIKTADAVPQIS